MDCNRVDHLWVIVLFLSAAWSLILMATITCEWSIGEQVKNSSTFWMAWRQVHFQQISIVGWTIPFIQNVTPPPPPPQKKQFFKLSNQKEIPFKNKLL